MNKFSIRLQGAFNWKNVDSRAATLSHGVHWVDKYRSKNYKTVHIDISDGIVYHIKAPKGEYQFVENGVEMDQNFKDYLLNLGQIHFH